MHIANNYKIGVELHLWLISTSAVVYIILIKVILSQILYTSYEVYNIYGFVHHYFQQQNHKYIGKLGIFNQSREIDKKSTETSWSQAQLEEYTIYHSRTIYCAFVLWHSVQHSRDNNNNILIVLLWFSIVHYSSQA